MKKMFKIGYTDTGGRLAGDRAHRQLVRNESPTAPGADGVHTAHRGRVIISSKIRLRFYRFGTVESVARA